MAVSMERARDPALFNRVLIVEDDPALCELLVLVFEEQGYEAIVESRGRGAVGAVRRLRPDVITLDLGLPDLDGQAILDQMSADTELRGIPVVVVSAFADSLRPTPQVSAVISKPFDLNLLLKTVAAVVRTG